MAKTIQPPREIIHNRLCSFWQHKYESIRFDERQRMQAYIDARDKGTLPQQPPGINAPHENLPAGPGFRKQTKIYPADAFRAVLS